MKLFSESHKTVFVVDHCPYMAESCRQHVEFDMLVKNRTQGIIPLAPISRSLWTCSVESSMEYCRIIDSHVRMLEEFVQETIHEHNKLAANSDHLMQIQKCELVLIHTYPVGEESLVSDHLKKEVSLLNQKLHYCTGAYRISPVDVNSRPSSCLTNFLLNGRSVLLEQPRKSGSKVISHMLSSHGGEIFLHVLSSSRSILEDPPSISEGCGGRDFGEFMRENRLAPFLEPRYKNDDSLEVPLERAKDQLEKHTRYWPMIISQTTIFNMQAVVPLASVIVKEALTDEDVLTCQKTIYSLVEMERKNDPLPISTVGTRGKGPKRQECFPPLLNEVYQKNLLDEQYRIMWNELETLVRAHIANSDKHQRVLECLLTCRSKPPEEEERKKRGRKREEKEDKSEKAGKDYESEKSWQESERLKGLLDREKEELVEAEIIKDSPDSPEPPNKKPLVAMDDLPGPEKNKGPISLLSLWSNRINAANSRKHQEFIGRLSSVNNKAELYQHLKEENGFVSPHRLLQD
ncbi:Cell cycle regulator Mat89Bb-like protein, partial [Ophiophagus hannah]